MLWASFSSSAAREDIRGKQDYWQGGRPDQVALDEAVIAGQGESGRYDKLGRRPNPRIQRAKAKRQEGVGQKVGKLHWPEPVVELNWREQSDVCQHPRPQHAIPIPVEANKEPKQADRNNRYDREGNLTRCALIIASRRKHRGDNDARDESLCSSWGALRSSKSKSHFLPSPAEEQTASRP